MNDHSHLPASLKITGSGPVRTLTLNRPESFNSVNEELHDGLVDVWRVLASDPEIRAVVLTGEGNAFCSGGDLTWFAALQDDHELRRRTLSQAKEIVREMLHFPVPVVAAVNGPATGLGCSLAVLSDVVLMAEGAYFADPHVAVGLVAGDGGATVWPAMMSLLRVKEFVLTGAKIPADEAVSLGLANRVVAGEDLVAEAEAMAHRLAKLPPQAVRETKRVLNLALEKQVAGSLEYAIAAESDSFLTPEHKAAVDKLLAK